VSVPTTAPDATGRVTDAVRALARGEMIVLVDAPDRENEGDLVMAAEHVTPAAIAFMAIHARGLICVPMLARRLAELGVPPMAVVNGDRHGTAFHVGVDIRDRTSSGISAGDRAATIRALVADRSTPEDFVLPGHVFPLAYRAGGVLRRQGHTEGSIDLAVLAGLAPATVICEIAADDGEMARGPELRAFAARHGLASVSISELVAHRRATEPLVARVADVLGGPQDELVAELADALGQVAA
jgi:3,4-dihydroxy-2-butanone 4-phosphate synthase